LVEDSSLLGCYRVPELRSLGLTSAFPWNVRQSRSAVCYQSQKNADLIHTAAKTWSLVQAETVWP